MKSKQRKLGLQRLEDRDVPASFGVPWSDPNHLTISFAPDGTSAQGLSSNLHAVLDAQLPRTVWQNTILRAAQTWSEAANISIGVVGDAGVPFGDPGAMQSDSRFGDIRIGALPMSTDAIGQAIPPDPAISGTLAGDVFFNTNYTYDTSLLYRVALHEIGHALGLPPSTDPRSVMFNELGNRTVLSASDVASIRSLYGARIDPYESQGNGSFATATPLTYSSDNDDPGEVPLAAFGSVNTIRDADFYSIKNLSDYSGPITFRVQSEGVSFLAPRLTIYDQQRRLIGAASSTETVGDTLVYTIAATVPGKTYFLRVDSSPGTSQRIGRYGVAVTFDNELDDVDVSIDEVMRGPYDALENDDLEELFSNPLGAIYSDDSGLDDDPNEANRLQALPGPLGFSRFRMTGSLTDIADVDFFKIRADRTGPRTPLVLFATARSIGANGVVPRIEVFDRNMVPLAADVLANGNGTFSIQVPGTESGRDYLIRVSGQEGGNFEFDAIFRKSAVPLQTFASGVAATTGTQTTVYVARTQLFGLSLEGLGAVGTSVRLQVTNELGQTVYDLTANAGEVVTGNSPFLAPGAYTITVTGLGSANPVAFRIRGSVSSDPLGPQPGDSTLAPKYVDPAQSSRFLYPNGARTFDAFLWLAWPLL